MKIVNDIKFGKEDCSRIDYWFYGRENEDFLYYEDKFFGRTNKILLKDLESANPEVTVTKSCLDMDKLYPPRSRHSIAELEWIIKRIVSVNQDFALLHASCVSNDHNTILFVAYPNVGKTLSCLQLLKEGYNYLSDDTLKVDRKGSAYLTSFPSAVGYYDFLRFIDPRDITKLKYLKFTLKSWIMSKSKIIERVLNPPLLELGKLYKTKEQALVDKICIIEIGPKKIREVSIDFVFKKIIGINQYSLARISDNPLIQAYSYFNNNFNIEEIENNNLSAFLTNCNEFYYLSCNDWNWKELFEEAKII